MKTETPQPIHLADYTPVPYLIDSVALDFRLDPQETRVTARLSLRPNPASREQGAALVFDGERITLQSLVLDGVALQPGQYHADEQSLTIANVPQAPFTLEVVTTCNPAANTELSGLYLSGGVFCTQCEAEGFRRITYFYDRPDVMARYTVRIEAEREQAPILLSNGNPRERDVIGGTTRHFAVWDDPFPKPSYLFALVAGDLGAVHDGFTTMSGRTVELGIYVLKGNEGRCAWAMESLKQSMRWDERRFGREYDLDVFNIVAVPDFNMGAMENKGLNVFNDKYILANPETATDLDYVNIEAIIAHEYFHNWTGNRITCRDWFQLCLKEGLTVFRDQEFTSDLRSRAVKRITDVKTLRARQFPEDNGPLAHPPRPDAYIEINNFYTPTVYEKGAEICRMMLTLIGEQAFRKAMDLYFDRHDGEAATVEQFVACMAEASGRDLTQFFTWYSQAGTPAVKAEGHYDAAKKQYTLTLEQQVKPTPGQLEKQALHIPLGIGLIGPDGTDMPLDLEGVGTLNTPLIELTEPRQSFRFNVAQRPVLSLNRGFSAPVKLEADLSTADELFLMGHDGDSFNRWEAGQRLGRRLVLDAYHGTATEAGVAAYAAALKKIIDDPAVDDAFKALMLMLPTESEIAAALGAEVDTDRVHAARDGLRTAIARQLARELDAIWQRTDEPGPYRPDPASTARRALRQTALALMVMGDRTDGIARALAEFEAAHNMSAEMGALAALVQVDCPERETALERFHARHAHEHLLVDKWLMLNAQAQGPGAAARIARLTTHPDFRWTTPNKVYALLSGFVGGNPAGFNAEDGSGYKVIADAILRLDPINPQVASRLATSFRSCKLLNSSRKTAAQAELERILAEPSLSRDVFEIVSKIATS
ncbi:aminopeptidase N [Aestuariivirga litoralis]|uniref:Aminopeptidase N n=1 Tax=Aestuariivirga litoralis TaxID=2650924 RepID=A0A2W2BPS3_9HYPH|nr:aminopeptidase N [Aestuariivirga litoralis]PZF77727.1 aminopeptidase N [Aestuariivirga litoralis]